VRVFVEAENQDPKVWDVHTILLQYC